jgi:hypothetical protein
VVGGAAGLTSASRTWYGAWTLGGRYKWVNIGAIAFVVAVEDGSDPHPSTPRT